MTRTVVLDLEFTGLDVDGVDRIVSVGIVELFNGKATGKKKEWFINPERPNDPAAEKIHGLTDEFLKTQPVFKDVVQEIVDFIDDAEIIHFCRYRKSDEHSTDERALTNEFNRAGRKPIPHESWFNMKKWAETLFSASDPKKGPSTISLDNMLDHFKINRNTRAKHHGALIDAELTAELYEKMAPLFPSS